MTAQPDEFQHDACGPCAGDHHDACLRRVKLQGSERVLAAALFGPSVTACCCSASRFVTGGSDA